MLEDERIAAIVDFAFACGIRLALEAAGSSLKDQEVVVPMLQRMARIVGGNGYMSSPHDDVPWEEARQMEQWLCSRYLKECKEKRDGQ